MGTPGGTGAAARGRIVLLAIVMLCGLVSFTAGARTEDDLETIEPGKLTVAFNGDLPMSSLRDGKLIGTDGEMISLIADRLGLEIVPQEMDWASAIESISAGRVDVMIGAVGWTAERSEVMQLSDPIYYFCVLLAQKSETSYHTFADLVGKNVGTVIGFSLVPELKSVPGIGEVKLYDTSDGAMRDLEAGRIDVAILDPALVSLAIRNHPEWNLHQIALAPDPAFPIMSSTYNATIALRKQAVKLGNAINDEIARFWASCENQRIMAEYGVTDASFFLPPVPNPRAGVDRAADWVSPTLDSACSEITAAPA